MDDPGTHFLQHIQPDELDALIETMYFVAYADGEFGLAEREHFACSLAALTAGRLTPRACEHVVARLVDDLGNGGRDAWVASVTRRLADPTLRQVALVLALDMAAADGELHGNERRLILQLADAFELHPEAMREVLEGPASSGHTQGLGAVDARLSARAPAANLTADS